MEAPYIWGRGEGYRDIRPQTVKPDRTYIQGHKYTFKKVIPKIDIPLSFYFVGCVKGAGLEHYLFRSVNEGYLMSFTAQQLKEIEL